MSDKPPSSTMDRTNQTKRNSGTYYPPPHQTADTDTVIVTKQAVQKTKFDSMFTEVPATVICSRCQNRVDTELEYVNGSCTWLTCTCLACFCCIFGCCLIPFCVDRCKDVEHRCPKCKCLMGTYHRL